MPFTYISITVRTENFYNKKKIFAVSMHDADGITIIQKVGNSVDSDIRRIKLNYRRSKYRALRIGRHYANAGLFLRNDELFDCGEKFPRVYHCLLRFLARDLDQVLVVAFLPEIERAVKYR